MQTATFTERLANLHFPARPNTDRRSNVMFFVMVRHLYFTLFYLPRLFFHKHEYVQMLPRLHSSRRRTLFRRHQCHKSRDKTHSAYLTMPLPTAADSPLGIASAQRTLSDWRTLHTTHPALATSRTQSRPARQLRRALHRPQTFVTSYISII